MNTRNKFYTNTLKTVTGTFGIALIAGSAFLTTEAMADQSDATIQWFNDMQEQYGTPVSNEDIDVAMYDEAFALPKTVVNSYTPKMPTSVEAFGEALRATNQEADDKAMNIDYATNAEFQAWNYK